MKHRRYSEAETQKVARELLSYIRPAVNGATVLGLSGDLGAGKTTLTKAIGEALGVAGPIQSPTFVIAKFHSTANKVFTDLIHIDAYRIEDEGELAAIGFERMLQNPATLMVVEWPEKIKAALPPHAHYFSILHDDAYRIINHEES